LDSEQKGSGSAIYKISSYIIKSTPEDANVSISFEDNTNTVTVTATEVIKKGDEIKTHFT
jgi:hypothetical protein